jgi:integrase
LATINRYQTASGTTLYRVRYRAPDNRQTDKRGFATKKAAQEFANNVEVAKTRGEYAAPSTGRVTIGQLGPEWLARQAGHVKPSSFQTYDAAYRTHVAPRWGAVKLTDVRFSDVQAWVSDLKARRGATVVRRSYRVLSWILADAVKDRMLASNPCQGVKLPAGTGRRHLYLSAEQLDRLAGESGRYRGLVLLLGVGGLRWGEAAALRVRDVDFLRRRITLTENAVTVGGQVHTGTLKTGKARTVALPAFVLDAISEVCAGNYRDALLWSTRTGTPLGPPAPSS